MCTVSWLHLGDGYQLLCNRDEKLSRLPARGPRIESLDGVRFVAPRDGDLGGTWIAVNEFGLTVCLLNRPGPARPCSRGLIVLDLVSATSPREAHQRLTAINLHDTSPFTLAMISPGWRAAIAEWDGQELTLQPSNRTSMPLTSSSFETSAVCAARVRDFRRRAQAAGGLDPAVLFDFHQGHGAGPSAYSTCMHRPDAETVSFSWIKVVGSNVEFFYTPAAPCQWQSGETYRLARRECPSYS